MDELFFGAELFGFVTFGDRGGKIAFAIVGHAERELGVEMRRVGGENRFQPGDRAVEISGAEIEHRVIVLFLAGHASVGTLTHPARCEQPAIASAGFVV